MENHIFLSYRSIEADFALQLAKDLKNAGVKIWMDRLDINPSQNWGDAIRVALNTCAGLVAVLSPDYFRSKYCPNELTRVYSLGKPIYPILLRHIDKQEMPIELELTQHIDFVRWQDSQEYSEKFEELIAAIKQKSADQVGAIPDVETRYLNSLIADLESRAGVTQYVELDATWTAGQELRPDAGLNRTWEAEFTLLHNVTSLPEAHLQDVVTTNITDAFKKKPRFVLIGEPGTGKTTTLHKLARDAAYSRLVDRSAPIPLFLYLPLWNQEEHPIDFVQTHWIFPHIDLSEALSRGDVWLYLDGLNEMGTNSKRKAEKLKDWLNGVKTPKRIVITCRTADYVGELNLGLATVTCNELTRPKIQDFVHKYLGEKRGKLFLERIGLDTPKQPQNNLAQLAVNPYLLSALIYVFDQMPNDDLPRNSGMLFKSLAKTLWQREYRRKTIGWQPFERMETQLAKLAYAQIKHDFSVDVPYAWALRQISQRLFFTHTDEQAKALLQASRSANLIDIRGDIDRQKKVRFYHQLLQEYFAAAHVEVLGIKRIIEPPRLSQNRREAGKWDQVIIALCGIHRNPDEILQTINEKDPYLASECIASGVNITEKTKKAVKSKLVDKWQSGDVLEKFVASRSLNLLGENVDELIASRESEYTRLVDEKDTRTDQGCRIYISYRRRPSASLAMLLRTKLEQSGLENVFVDSSRQISGGAFPERLLETIIQSDVFVVLLASDTLQSEWVVREIEYALQHNKRIVPVFQEGFDVPAHESLSPSIKDIFNYDGVPIFDKRNIYIDEAIAQLIRLINSQCS